MECSDQVHMQMHAHVWFPYPINKTANVPVADITDSVSAKDAFGNRKRTPFAPKTDKDFNKEQLYVLKTSERSRDGQAHPYYCYIGVMAGESS